MAELSVNGMGTFRYFVVVGKRGYACKDMSYNGQDECVLHVAAVVTSSGWYWPDAELRFPKASVLQIVPGAWTYGGDTQDLSDRVKLVTTGSR